MYREVAKLILYRDLGEDSILLKLAQIFEDFENGCEGNARLITRIYEQMNAKGWYPDTPAPQDKINEAVQQHIQGATNITKTTAKAKKSVANTEKAAEKKTEKATSKKAK